MKPPCQAVRVNSALMAILAVLLLAMTAATASADPQPGPTTLTAAAEVRADFLVVVAGTLLDQAGAPVPGATIRARVNGDETAKAVTNGEGGYLIEFTAGEALRTEPQPLVVVFEGRGGLAASQADATVKQVDTPDPPAPPKVARQEVALSAATASSSVSAGGLVIIEGTLAAKDGAPVSGVRIRVMLDDNESSDSLVITDEAGAFQTFAEVPSERPAGEASLVVSFAGNDSYEAARQEIGLVVELIPVADRTTPEASPTVTEVAESSASMDASMVATGDEDSPEVVEDEARSPLSWFYVALVVVGGAALLITAGLVFRGMYGRSGESVSRRAGSLDMLLGQANEDGEESDGLTLDAPDDGPPDHGDADANSGEDARPRRGLDQ